MSLTYYQPQKTFNDLLVGEVISYKNKKLSLEYKERIERANNLAFDIYGFNGTPQLNKEQLRNMSREYEELWKEELSKEIVDIIKRKIEWQK